MSEEAKKKLQELAVQAQLIVDQMAGIAHANRITSIPFLRGVLQFGMVFEGSPTRGEGGKIRNLSGYHPARYPIMNTDGYEWRASSFECYPTDEQREWMFGENKANWPKTDYEDE